MKRALTDEQKREIAERYKAGETLAQLATAYGCKSRSTIHYALRKLGVRRRRLRIRIGRDARCAA